SGDRILLVGHGKLGHLIEQTLALTGCELTVLSRAAARPPHSRFDVAIECSGSPEGFAIARSALRPRGTLVMKSTYAGTIDVNMSALVVDEITLVGSRCGPFEPALRLLADRKVDVRQLIHATYALDDALTAFEHAQQRGVLKCIIAP